MATANENCSLKNEIKELLHHLAPILANNESSENLLDTLLYLSETDPNFHKIEFVKYLRRRIRLSLSPVIEKNIDKYLECNNGKIKGESNVDNICNVILKKPEYLVLEDDLRVKLEESIADIAADPDEEEIEYYNINDIPEFSQRSSSSSISLETSLNSSLNQSGFLLVSSAEYEVISENLKRKRAPNLMDSALNMLLSVTPGEPVSQTLWPEMRKGLREILQLNHKEFFTKSLQIHIRLLTSQTHIAVKEGFINIVEALSNFWLSRKLSNLVASKNATVPLEGNAVMILTKILTSFLKDFSSIIIRYPSQYVSDMLDSFLQLFSIKSTSKRDEKLGFFDIICFIDPKTKWFLAWTHSHYSRKLILKSLQNSPSLLWHSVFTIIDYIQHRRSCAIKIQSNTVSPQSFDFLRFYASTSIVFSIVKYSEGKLMFPLYDNVNKQHYSLRKLLQFLIDGVRNSKQYLTIKTIMNCFVLLCNSNENNSIMISEIGIIENLINTIEVKYDSLVTQDKTQHFVPIMEFFYAFSNSDHGKEYLLLGETKDPSKIHFNVNIQTPAERIFNIFAIMFKGSTNLPPKLAKLCFSLAISILKSPLGQYFHLHNRLVKEFILSMKKANFIKENFLDSENLGTKLDLNDCYEYAARKLLSCSLGCHILHENGLLSHVLDFVLPQLAEEGQISPRILINIVKYVEGCGALSRHSIVEAFWDLQKYFISSYEDNDQFKHFSLSDKLEQSILPLLFILSSYEGVISLFSNEVLSKEILVQSLSFDFDKSELHTLVLKMLALVSSNLTALVYLNAKFNLQNLIIEHQSLNIYNGSLITDENSILRGKILSSLFCQNQELFPQVERIDENMTPTVDVTKEVEEDIEHIENLEQNLFKENVLFDTSWRSMISELVAKCLLSAKPMKVSLMYDLVEAILNSLSQSPEEILPARYKRIFQSISSHSKLTSSVNNKVFSYSPKTSCYAQRFETFDYPGSSVPSFKGAYGKNFGQSHFSVMEEHRQDFSESSGFHQPLLSKKFSLSLPRLTEDFESLTRSNSFSDLPLVRSTYLIGPTDSSKSFTCKSLLLKPLFDGSLMDESLRSESFTTSEPNMRSELFFDEHPSIKSSKTKLIHPRSKAFIGHLQRSKSFTSESLSRSELFTCSFYDDSRIRFSKYGSENFKDCLHKAIVDIIMRYVSIHNLSSENEAKVDLFNFHKSFKNELDFSSNMPTFDGMFLLAYCLAEGNTQKASALLGKLSDLKIGAILMSSLSTNYARSNDKSFNYFVIFCTKLVLFRDSPSVYLVLEDFCGGVIWTYLGEWLKCGFAGVVPWPQNIYLSLLIPIVKGPCYLVYSLASLLSHLHVKLIPKSPILKTFQALLFIRSEAFDDWKIQDYLPYMERLSSKFHDIISELIEQRISQN